MRKGPAVFGMYCHQVISWISDTVPILAVADFHVGRVRFRAIDKLVSTTVLREANKHTCGKDVSPSSWMSVTLPHTAFAKSVLINMLRAGLLLERADGRSPQEAIRVAENNWQ